LEQILEEVVGKFTTILPGMEEEIRFEDEFTVLVRGNTFLRDINRRLDWDLPTENAKTVNGLIIEYLEDIPHANTCFKLGNYMIEIVQTRDTSVHVARIQDLSSGI
jgi:Mg2+/Co2+ transporter CorB